MTETPHLENLFVDDFELLPTAVQIDLVCCFASFASGVAPQQQQHAQQLRERAIVMLTILSTILHEPGPFLVDALEALASLLGTPFVRQLAKKRSSLLAALRRCLIHDKCSVRVNALAAARLLLLDLGSTLCDETTRMVRSIAKAALKEENSTIRLELVRSMAHPGDAILKLAFVKDFAISILKDAADNDLAEVSASLFFRFLRADLNPSIQDLLFGVHCLRADEHDSVRLQALKFLDYLSFWRPASIKIVLDETKCLDYIASILLSGHQPQMKLAVQICHQFAFNGESLPFMCKHGKLVDALIRVSQRLDETSTTNTIVILNGLALHSAALGPHETVHKILPWLVKIANRTSNEDLKEVLVGAVENISQTCILSLRRGVIASQTTCKTKTESNMTLNQIHI